MIFLGLASSYSFGRTVRHLFAFGSHRDSENLRQDLAARYDAVIDQVALYHTGRSALAAALVAVAEPGAKVILPGLTCIAVVRAIKAAGCVPIYSDIDPRTLQYDFDALDKTLKLCYDNDIRKENQATPDLPESEPRYPRSIILVQNTLGLPIDAQKLEELAKKHDAIIVEDLAHSAGRFYPDGREIGTIGAATALSFGKGKAIDTICGGAVIIRQPKSQLSAAQLDPSSKQLKPTRPNPLPQPVKRPRFASSLRDRWYPVFAGLSRALWTIGLGKFILAACVKLHWIEKSADAELSLETCLTHWQARLARQQLQRLPRTPLRDHSFVRDRDKLLQELKTHGYDFAEIWYDTPVSPVRYAFEADFPSERCPATIRVAEHIINLPTWYPAERLAAAREIIKPYEVEL